MTPDVAFAAEGDNYFVTALKNVVNGVLYGIFVALGMFASVAVTMFGWAIKPEYISGPDGFLNLSSVYDMWKFIRDFFNLLFILTLLYTAFTIVFQVAKNYKQTLLSLVLAAMFVNFSFPITRVIIDMTNVPMYFFINKIATTGDGSNVLGTVLSASQLENILLPKGPMGIDVSQMIMAIVFMFLFSVTLLVLAVMFVIRLAALVILLIFSSVGFAAAVIPGLSDYSAKWWKALWQYALFGPAAALMLVVATNFFAQISKGNTPAQFSAVGNTAATQVNVGFIGSMAMFSIPIIILWMAIGLASSMSLVGAGAVVGRGERFAKWVGKKSYNNSITRGFSSGIKSRLETKFPVANRFLTSHGGTEAAIKGWTKKTSFNPLNRGKGREGARTELQKLKDKQIHEQIGKDKENKLSRADAIKRLDPSTDEVMRISAATSLANMDNGIQSMDDLTKALDALKDPTTGTTNPAYTEKAVEIIAKADKKIIASTTNPSTGVTTSGLQNLNSVITSLGTNEKAINDLISKLDDSAFDGSAAEYGAVRGGLNPSLVGSLEAKMRKEGQSKVLVDYERGQNVAAGMTPVQAMDAAFKKVVGSMDADTLAKQTSIHADSDFQTYLTVDLLNPANRGYYQEVFKRMKQKDRQEWISKGNVP